MKIAPVYPTPQHAAAADAVVAYFADQQGVEAVLLFGSTARGKASPDSCLDLMVLLRPDEYAARRDALSSAWEHYYASQPVFEAVLKAGAYSNVEVDLVNGIFTPGYHGWTSGADEFELAIGNTLVYSAALFERGSYLQELKARWLPYYSEDLRAERLAMVGKYCLNNLDHIPLYIERGLYFQCFHRLCNAFYEFLQGLFISRRLYPIAYDKWVREQFEEVLMMPELYQQLPALFEISRFESRELAVKAADLRQMVEQFILQENAR